MNELDKKVFDKIDLKEVSFFEIFNVISRSKNLLILTIFFSILSGLIYSLSIDNVYLSSFKSESKIISDNSINDSGLMFQQILGMSQDSTLQKVINQIRSKDFFETLMENPVFMDQAGLSYDFSFDKNHHIFLNSKLYLKEYPLTESLELGILDSSPQKAFSMIEIVMNSFNEFSKEKDIIEAKKSNEYLLAQMGTTNIPELRQSISNLIKYNLKTLALAEASETYKLKILDSPRIPNFKFKPNRVLILIGFLVFFITMYLIIISFFFIKNKFIDFSFRNLKISLEEIK
jgi:hypothetical protein